MSALKEHDGHADMADANFPMDNEGRTYHVGCKKGELANRILTVGSHNRALRIAKHFDAPGAELQRTSDRGFTVLTGKRNGTPISIVAIGMGYPMMDFFVREVRAVVEGPLLIMRFGTCGVIRRDVDIGAICVASQGARGVFRNPDAFPARALGDPAESPYRISKPVGADAALSAAAVAALHAHLDAKKVHVVECRNASADSFYSSQGRLDAVHFDDANKTLVDEIAAADETVATLEMESFHLLHLAACSRGSIRASAAHISLAQRFHNSFLPVETTQMLETHAGEALLDALVNTEMDAAEPDAPAAAKRTADGTVKNK